MRHIFLKLLVILYLPFSCFEISDSFDRNVEDLLYEKIQDKKALIEISYNATGKVAQIKSKQNEIKNVVLINYEPERASFKIIVNYLNGNYDELTGHYETYVEVPVTSRLIKAGEIILASDITFIKTKVSRLRENYILSENDIIGMQAKKHLSMGSLVKMTELSRPVVIKMHDPVNITYSSGNIDLKISGIALGNGAVGGTVRVKNEDSGAVMLGRIINKNTVQVGGE